MQRIRLLWVILKRSGVEKVIVSFLAVYFACALVLLISEASVKTYGDALWFLWAVSTTVGLGDFTAVTHIGRIATVLCSIYAIITIAILTGMVVDYFNEMRQRQFDASLAEFLDKLERLPELDKEELEHMSKRIQLLRKERTLRMGAQ